MLLSHHRKNPCSAVWVEHRPLGPHVGSLHYRGGANAPSWIAERLYLDRRSRSGVRLGRCARLRRNNQALSERVGSSRAAGKLPLFTYRPCYWGRDARRSLRHGYHRLVFGRFFDHYTIHLFVVGAESTAACLWEHREE